VRTDATVAVFEPHSSGHRASYVKWIVEEVLRRGHKAIVIAGPSAMSHPVFVGLQKCERVSFIAMDPPAFAIGARRSVVDLIASDLTYFRALQRQCTQVRRAVELDAIVLPYMDYAFYSIAALGSPFACIPWCGITLRTPTPSLSRSEPLRTKFLRRICSRPSLRAVFSIDPALPRFLEDSRGARMQGRLRYLADPVERPRGGDRGGMRARLGISTDAHVLLVLGTIDARKGLRELLDGLADSGNDSCFLVLLAGTLSDYAYRTLSSASYAPLVASGRVKCLNKVLDETEMEDCLAAADAAWVGYIGHRFVSGVFLQAASRGLVVIATTEGAIGQVAGGWPRAVLLDPTNRAEVVDGLRRAEALIGFGAIDESVAELLSNHSVAAFGAAVVDAIAGAAT
jgi:glycosyltransferase involved in cell wall biosynthesis